MKTSDWLQEATAVLSKAEIGTARLDSLILLEDVTDHDRGWLLAHPEFEIVSSQISKLNKLLKQRTQHRPLAYVRGRTEFYGRDFVISPAVLEPRPESETMVTVFKSLTKTGQKLRIADVGCGSGALGITVALELPNSRVELLDIDPKVLELAQINVDKFTPSLKVIKSDLLNRSTQANDILLCNLPYVPDDYQINRAATHEPSIAIFGGPDGLDLYRRLFKQVSQLPEQPLYILTEALPPQHTALAEIAYQSGYKTKLVDDFIQAFELN